MSDTIPVSQQQIEEMSNRIVHFEKMVGQLMEKIGDLMMSDEALIQRYKENYVYEEGEPEYGTDAWWEWSIKQGEDDIKAGKVTTLQNKEEIEKFFDNI